MRFATLAVAIGIALLLGGNVAFASIGNNPGSAPSHNGPGNNGGPPPTGYNDTASSYGNYNHHPLNNSVSLVMAGGVVSPGVQTYYMRGGQVASAWILGSQVPPGFSQLYYSLNVVVYGLTATGSASFDLLAPSPARSHMEVKGFVSIDSITPAIMFPLGCTPGINCTGAIPALFNGTATITIIQGKKVSTMTLAIGIESPYLNPFGGPIFIATNSNEVVIVATYSQASIQWTDVQMGGYLSGTVGGNSVSGTLGMLVNSSEDLKSGTEFDRGIIAFSGMSNPSLDAVGTFTGLSVIPRSSAVSCPGFPPGTCSETGLESAGLFSQTTAGGRWLSGSYTTSWTVPAVAFTSIVTGKLK